MCCLTCVPNSVSWCCTCSSQGAIIRYHPYHGWNSSVGPEQVRSMRLCLVVPPSWSRLVRLLRLCATEHSKAACCCQGSCSIATGLPPPFTYQAPKPEWPSRTSDRPIQMGPIGPMGPMGPTPMTPMTRTRHSSFGEHRSDGPAWQSLVSFIICYPYCANCGS